MSAAVSPDVTHTRIRPFNTRETYPEQNLDNDLCQAVVAGGVVYLRGQIGQDLDTRESVGIGDVEVQAEKAMSNIAMLLDEAGSSLRDIVKVTVYLTDIRYRESVYRVMGRWLKGVYPGVDRTGGRRTRAAGMARRDRRDRSAQRAERSGTMTMSLVARDPASGAFGIIVCSSSPAVAARCAHPRAGVGVVASQNVTNPALGPAVLDRLSVGLDAEKALTAALSTEQHPEYRQVSVVDAHGQTALHSGARSLGTYGGVEGDQSVAAGNMLADLSVLESLLTGYADSVADAFEQRLLDGLRAALDAGGEEGPVHSAGLLVVEDVPWPVTDLRVDFADDPLGDLASLWQIWQPQKNDYRVRGVDPTRAPSYGVPGDL